MSRTRACDSSLRSKSSASHEIDQAVIDSEQEMADTFTDNELIPDDIDVSSYFADEYNADTTGTAVEQ